MYGAILGDIIGSPYEFDMGNKTKDFPFFDKGCMYTDDTVMTIAVCDALLKAELHAPDDIIRFYLIKCMKEWGRRYPDAGYGSRFFWWLNT